MDSIPLDSVDPDLLETAGMTDKTIYLYAMQMVFVGSIMYGYQGFNINNANDWMTTVARYILYIHLIKASKGLCFLSYTAMRSKRKPDLQMIWNRRNSIFLFFVSTAVLLYYKQKLLGEDFLIWFIAYLITKYFELGQKPPVITYGVGMACSYFETYLSLMLPSDGASFVGLEANIERYSARQGITFPVKKMFIVITKSLYCPPDLTEFNRKNRPDLPYLEACRPLETVKKDVAGVKNRKFHNSVYKIHRGGKPAVYLTTECASPLHVLYNVMQKTARYGELVKADHLQIADDFCGMLTKLIQNSPECRNKCVLIYLDDTDPNQNLADILLDQIRIHESNFENILDNKEL